MNGNDLLIDSNVLVYYMLGFNNVEKYFKNFRPVLSFVTELEVLSGPSLYPQQSDNIKLFLSEYVIIDYVSGLKEIIVDIRKSRKLKLPDAIIAATAIHLDIPLVSADKAFTTIAGLNLILHDPAIN